MLRRGRISEGWLGELYAGEDAQGRSVRFISLAEYTEANRQWVADRIRLMNTTAISGAIPQLGIQLIQGEPCWIGAWRDAVQLSAVLESKHIPNTVIMAVAFGVLQSLHSAHQKGIVHGVLHPNGIWLGLDGAIWLDGYGHKVDSEHTTEHDIYLLGIVLIEMFLGSDAVPEDGILTSNHIRQFGMELQAMGLPNKLPKQILSLVHPDISKRPTADLLVRKWKLTRAQAIIASWVRAQFPSIQTAHRPEDRIPTSSRIAPLPFPSPIEIPEIEPVVSSVLDDDDTMLQSRIKSGTSLEASEEQTQTLHVESVEEVSQDLPEVSEETQEVQFVSSFEADFFDAEPTSKLVVDAFFAGDEADVEVEDVRLQEEMDDVAVRSRRPLMGLVWIAVVGMTLIVMLYMMIPSMPNYPDAVSDGDGATDKKSVDQDGESAKEELLLDIASPTRASIENVNHKELEEPVPVESNQVRDMQVAKSDGNRKAKTVSQKQPANPNKSRDVQRTTKTKQNTNKSTKTSPLPSKPSKRTSTTSAPPQDKPSPAKPAASKVTDEQSKSTNEGVSKEQTVEQAPVEEKKPVGTVRVTGDVEKVRLEMNGRDVPVGEVSPGEYTVYATFAGFNEFKVSTITVEDGGSYTVYCDSLFATCKVK